LPFEEVIFQARPRRKRGRKIKAIDHSQAKAAWRHGMQWIGINPNAEKMETTERNEHAHRPCFDGGRDRPQSLSWASSGEK